jgi:hypothetical protein
MLKLPQIAQVKWSFRAISRVYPEGAMKAKVAEVIWGVF